MPKYAVKYLAAILKKRNKTLSNTKILVLGATYKKDVKDLRKSPSLVLIELLQKTKASVSYYDPMVPYLKIGSIDLKAITLDKQTVKKFDCVIVAVDHTRVDYTLIRKHAKLIYDIRNVYKGAQSTHIVRF